MRRLASLAAVTLAIALPASAAPLQFNLFGAVDTGGALSLSSLDLDNGYSAGFEVVVNLPVLDIGGGAEYGFPRRLVGEHGEYSYTLVYALARLNVLGPAYVVGRYGYNDPSIKDLEGLELKGSAAWGAGVGASFLGYLKVEVMYTSIGGDVSYDATLARVIFSF